MSTPKLEKSTSSHTLDSITTEDSDSSPKESSTSAASAIPSMPIRKMKDLTEDTGIADEEGKFPKSVTKKESSKGENAELVGFKNTLEKPKPDSEVPLTKEEMKNRELEKVQKEYAEKQKKKDEAETGDDPQSPATPRTDSDSASISSSVSSKRSGDDKKPVDMAGLASLTADLKAVEGDAKANMKVPTEV